MTIHAIRNWTSYALDGSASIGYKAKPDTYVMMCVLGNVPKYKKGTSPTLQEELQAWETAAQTLQEYIAHAHCEVDAFKAEIAKQAVAP